MSDALLNVPPDILEKIAIDEAPKEKPDIAFITLVNDSFLFDESYNYDL